MVKFEVISVLYWVKPIDLGSNRWSVSLICKALKKQFPDYNLSVTPSVINTSLAYWKKYGVLTDDYVLNNVLLYEYCCRFQGYKLLDAIREDLTPKIDPVQKVLSKVTDQSLRIRFRPENKILRDDNL